MIVEEVGPFLHYFDRIRERTLRAARRVPADRLEWAPGPGRWTPGDLLRHLVSIERWMFVENACLRPSHYPGHGRELAEGLPAVLELMERWHAESVELLSGLGPDQLQRRCRTPGGAELPVWKWLRAMIEHECHHRGQLYLHLTTLGVDVPPLYGLTEEEVEERSRE